MKPASLVAFAFLVQPAFAVISDLPEGLPLQDVPGMQEAIDPAPPVVGQVDLPPPQLPPTVEGSGLPGSTLVSVGDFPGTESPAGAGGPGVSAPGGGGPSQPPSPPSGGGTAPVHTVVSGDTLWDLAERYCGSGNQWPALFEANRGQIQDPDLIFPGQQFVMACSGGASAGPRPPGPGVKAGPGPAPSTDRIRDGKGFMTHLPLRPGDYRVSSGFGPRTPPRTPNGRGSSNHEGIDLSAPSGTPIFAAGPGTVEVAEMRGGYGYAVYIRHDNGYVTRYGHMLEPPSVRAGQRVEGGQQIGKVGSTGRSSGPHLHFEVRRPNGSAINPAGCAHF